MKKITKKEAYGWLLVSCIGFAIYYFNPEAIRERRMAHNEVRPDLLPDGSYPGEFYPEVDVLWPEDVEPETAAPVPPAPEKKQYIAHNTNLRAPVAKPDNSGWYVDGSLNYFRCVILETKRREALGRPGAELKRYKDGNTWAIGYGCHIKYLSEYWQRTAKRQGWKVKEMQARQIMYEVMHNLEQQVKRDLPNANRRQRLAVISLAYNWGYGNVKKSGLWRHLKAGNQGSAISRAWMQTQNQTENHKKSRRMEIALWNGADRVVLQTGKAAFDALQRRGDFQHYE